MVRMTAQDFVDFTRRRMGNPSTDDWSDTDILRFVNMAIERVAADHWDSIPELETTTDVSATSGTATYELSASDVLKITAAKNVTKGIVIEPVSRGIFNQDTQGATTPTGDVVGYMLGGTGSNDRPNVTLYFTPTESLTIRFWYIKIPTEIVLTPTATSPEVPRRWDEAILDYAAEIGKKFDQQMQSAQAERQMAALTNRIAETAGPLAPHKRWPIKSKIADVVNENKRKR